MPILSAQIFALITAFIAGVLHLNAFANCRSIQGVVGHTPTGKGGIETFNWLVMEAGKVSALGRGKVPARHAKCAAIDLDGRFVLPGLIDAHGHISGLGAELATVQLRGVDSARDAADRVKAYGLNNPSFSWILGSGWNQVLWPGKQFPDRKVLDATGIKRPVMLNRIDGHAAWVNTAALKLAGIDDNTPDPPGGQILRDRQGKATGVLIDRAMALVEAKLPPDNLASREATLARAFRHLLSVGIVSVHDAGVGPLDLAAFKRMRDQGPLPVRVYAMLSGDHAKLPDWLAAGPRHDKRDSFVVNSVKLYADGALGSRGAALLEPYSDAPKSRGLLLSETAELKTQMKRIIDSGFQVNVHAIGDRGNRIVLDIFESLLKTPKLQAMRHRVEHAQVLHIRDIPRFLPLGLIASMQPTHATSDKNMAGDRLGLARLRGAYAWQQFIQQGTVVAAGSDFPVEKANPFHGLHAAITRQDQKNQPLGGWLPKEKMSLAQALKAFTIDAAYAAHQEQRLGGLAPGKWADFVVVDRDVTEISPDTLWQTRVLETWVAGKPRYRAQ